MMAAVCRYSATRLLFNFSISQCKNHSRICNINQAYFTSSSRINSPFSRSRHPLITRIGVRTEVTGTSELKTEPEPVQENKQQVKPEKKPKAAPALEGIINITNLDIRVGKILNVKKHPDAHSLYVEEVDIGDEKPRTVVSGLVNHVPIEELENRLVVLLCNVKPSKMRGVTSEAMVLCATTTEKMEMLLPPEGSVPGDRITVEGYEGTPDTVLNPKKKIFETVAVDLKTNDSKVATYKGAALTVPGKGVVSVFSLVGANIK